MKKMYINCDMGEGSGADAELMPLISACNIACGGHAGTLETMQHTVDLAMEHKVQIGAHPAYPDKEHFGRATLDMPAEELKRSLVAQILSLKQIAEAEGATLEHVKPHGALYHDALWDPGIAVVVLDAILEFKPRLELYAPEGSVLANMAEGKIPVRFEVFADRNYRKDGELVPRSHNSALITNKEEVLEHVNSILFQQEIICENGEKVRRRADTFCVHADTPNILESLKYLHQKLPQRGVVISAGS